MDTDKCYRCGQAKNDHPFVIGDPEWGEWEMCHEYTGHKPIPRDRLLGPCVACGMLVRFEELSDNYWLLDHILEVPLYHSSCEPNGAIQPRLITPHDTSKQTTLEGSREKVERIFDIDAICAEMSKSRQRSGD